MRLVSFVRGFCLAVGLISATLGPPAHAEDGYDLWLRYRPLPAALRPEPRTIAPGADTPTLKIARAELRRGLDGLVGGAPAADGPSILLGTPAGSPAIAALNLPLKGAGEEGYLIRTLQDSKGGKTTVIAANSDIGVLYGVFHYLRLVQTGAGRRQAGHPVGAQGHHRLLNHWDNLDGSVERGYAGASLWDWWKLPDYKDPRYVDYARANASIGINGAVLNNVNAKADSLTAPYIAKAAALADVFRPYGIKVYLSARFSAPIEIGG
jgi:alpha-glucuronidase